MQLYNVFRNRWCSAYWVSKGIRVIPTVNWGDESMFDFCFERIEKGSIVYVDYKRSSWKYMRYERSFQKKDFDAFKIGKTYCAECDTIEPYLIGRGTFKGGGSAYGGGRKPSKPEDYRLIGKPGEIKVTYAKGWVKD